MKFDLEKTGLERVLRPWQAEAWRILWEIGVPMKSSDMKRELDNREASTSGRGSGGRGGVSRASVINFLNDMFDKGFLTYTEETGKGGYHRVYELAPEASDEESFKLSVAQGILTALKLDWGVSLEEIL